MKWDKTVDVVVVGLGAAGGCAAIEAYDNGADVLVIEADKVPGGNTRLSGGTLRVFLDNEKVYQYYRGVFDDTVKDDLIHKFVEVTATSHEWFKQKCDCDFKIAEKVPFPPAPNAVWDFLPGSEGLGGRSQFVPKDGSAPGMNGGYYLIASLMHGVNKRGIKIQYETRGKELVTNASGEVIGIKAETPDGPCFIRAKKAVCLTCGGFNRNAEMQTNYLGMPLMSQGCMCSVGDGLTMTAKLGAKMWHMTGVSCGVSYKVKDHEQPIGIGMHAPNYMYVDQNGERFLNESGLDVHAMAFDFTACNAEKMAYPRMPAWMIFDENVREAGPIIGHCPGIIQEDPTWEGWSQDNQREIEKGWIKMAYTIADLGKQLGYNPGVLEKAVADYNQAALTGYDPKFNRDCFKMGPITKLPFYAIELWPSLLNTQGGPMHDAYGRVLDNDEKPIERLFAAGELGSIVNKFYPGGTNITEAIAMGRVIGEYTAKLADTVE
ncbi:FAD-dependent oxidoreductase [Anaerotruncus rubiinfantis]|uniref:FAD-dependent oxidoreductase n=2 Tax=Anaerotruncus rubiinfantis TaxID=1720200 RepID=UPI0011C9467A|nr:FAD-dependent oxidoreductase [Anaerotruncus rubiinfantis]